MPSSPSPPQAPNPQAVANASTESNRNTAYTQAGLNFTSQNTPTGSLQYTPGTDQFGNRTYSASSSYSPTEQPVYEAGAANRGAAATGAGNILGNWLQQNPNGTTSTEIFDQLNNMNNQYNEPIWRQQQQELDAGLRNQGIFDAGGGEENAYNRSQRGLHDQQQRDRTQFALAMEPQAFTQSQAPLAQSLTLAGYGQPAAQNFNQTPQTSVQPTDVGNIYNQNYQNQMSGYNAQLAQQNAMMGGLFSIPAAIGGGWARSPAGGTALTGLLSDRRMKEDVKEVGRLFNGATVYSFRYIGDTATQIGLMAQDVEKYAPEAVQEFNGIKYVDYAKAI